MDAATIGKQIKEAYPGYGGLPDDLVGQRYIDKYQKKATGTGVNNYFNQPTVPTTTETTPEADLGSLVEEETPFANDPLFAPIEARQAEEEKKRNMLKGVKGNLNLPTSLNTPTTSQLLGVNGQSSFGNKGLDSSQIRLGGQ